MVERRDGEVGNLRLLVRACGVAVLGIGMILTPHGFDLVAASRQAPPAQVAGVPDPVSIPDGPITASLPPRVN